MFPSQDTKDKLDNAIDKYLDFANKSIEKYNDLKDLIDNNDMININLVNKHLTEYMGVIMFLITEEKRLLINYEYLEDEFNKWYDEKFCEVRSENNKLDISGNKWLSQTELNSITRNKYKEEYYYKKQILREEKVKYETISSILKTYNKVDELLRTLSSNLRTDWFSESKVNKTNKQLSDAISKKEIRVRTK